MTVKAKISPGKCRKLLLAWWFMSFRDIHLYACNLVHNPSNGMMIDVKEFILSCLVQVKASVYMFFSFTLCQSISRKLESGDWGEDWKTKSDMNSIYANKVFLEPNYVVFMIDSLFLSVCDRPMNFSCKKLCVGQHVKDRIDQIVLYRIINLIHGCSSNLILYMYRKVYAFSHASTNVSRVHWPSAPPNNQLVPHISRKNAYVLSNPWKKNHVNNQRSVLGEKNQRGRKTAGRKTGREKNQALT